MPIGLVAGEIRYDDGLCQMPISAPLAVYALLLRRCVDASHCKDRRATVVARLRYNVHLNCRMPRAACTRQSTQFRTIASMLLRHWRPQMSATLPALL